MNSGEGKRSFFMQGGWMVMATGAAGAFMILVHTVSRPALGNEQYGDFGALLKIFLFLGIPASGLQTVFARQAAAAVDSRHARQLATTTRAVLAVTFGLWLAAAAGILGGWRSVAAWLKIDSQAALLFTVALGLASLWMPLLKGVLQGRQQFGGLGWASIVEGVLRFSAILLLVVAVRGGVGSAMGAVLFAQAVALALAAWWTRAVWLGQGERVEWRPWLADVVPLTLGSAAMSFIALADMLFVKSVFVNDCDLYVAGQNSGFALSQLTIPLAAVMFPKIARSAARAEKTNVLTITLQSTLVVGGLVALACTALPWLPLRLVYFLSFPKVAAAAVLVPWSVWSLLIYASANVLVSHLLARRSFRIVPWLAVVATAYGMTLWGLTPTLLRGAPMDGFRLVIQVQLVYSVLLLGLAVYFSRAEAGPNQP